MLEKQAEHSASLTRSEEKKEGQVEALYVALQTKEFSTRPSGGW